MGAEPVEPAPSAVHSRLAMIGVAAIYISQECRQLLIRHRPDAVGVGLRERGIPTFLRLWASFRNNVPDLHWTIRPGAFSLRHFAFIHFAFPFCVFHYSCANTRWIASNSAFPSSPDAPFGISGFPHLGAGKALSCFSQVRTAAFQSFIGFFPTRQPLAV